MPKESNSSFEFARLVQIAVSMHRGRGTSACGSTPPKVRSNAQRQLIAGQRLAIVDETRLLRAIRTLDNDKPLPDTSAQISEAFAFFLELLLMLGRMNAEDTDRRAELETIWEARVLGCLQRFVSKRKHLDKSFVGCCDRLDAQVSLERDYGCVQRLVCYTLVSIVYFLSSGTRLAVAIVKNDLHRFVFEFGGGIESPDHLQQQDQQSPSYAGEAFDAPLIDIRLSDLIDARDLLLSIDPFDWCYQSTCAEMTTSSNRPDDAAIFFVPVGARSLRYLLGGEELPTDEVTEHDQELRRCATKSTEPISGSPTRSKRAGTRRLPSIFTFQTAASLQHSDTSLPPASFPQCKRRSDPAFRVLSSPLSLQHMALRTAVALLHNLPRSSPERRALVRSDSRCIRFLMLHAYDARTTALRQDDNTCEEPDASIELVAEDIGLKSFQTLATEPRLLSRIALCALASVHRDEIDAILKVQPKYAAVLQHFTFVAQSSPSPSSNKPVFSTTKSTKATPKISKAPATSLADRLRRVREETKREIECSNAALEQDRALQHSIRRQQLRAQCERLEQLRQQLSQSLSVLRSGRKHADPTQSFLDWIESLPTIEKMEQERRLAEHTRQQHAIETQYQREETRKRERNERTMMQQNDRNALDETAQSRMEQKRLAFLRMHEEIQLLERQQQEHQEDTGEHLAADTALAVHDKDDDHDSDDDSSVSRIQAKMRHQHTLSVHRRQTQAKLENERNRLICVRERKQEAAELERMCKEDLYYVEKLQRLKQLDEEQRKQQQQLLQAKNAGNPIEEQQKKIERMRQRDLERKLADKESEHMRTEDLLARQRRYLETERDKLQEQRERSARKQMETEERNCRARWKLVEQEQVRLEELEAKRLRVEARRMRKWQQAYDKQVLAAWVESWDASGNVYYYNGVTGVSQWESPFVSP